MFRSSKCLWVSYQKITKTSISKYGSNFWWNLFRCFYLKWWSFADVGQTALWFYCIWSWRWNNRISHLRNRNMSMKINTLYMKSIIYKVYSDRLTNLSLPKGHICASKTNVFCHICMYTWIKKNNSVSITPKFWICLEETWINALIFSVFFYNNICY